MWTEFQAGVECLTQLLLLIERMSTEDFTDFALTDAAEVLQDQLIYNGEVLEIALESLKAYKDGTQSLVYLDSSVHLAYALLRMLEKWTKAGGGREMYVRKKVRRKKPKGLPLSPVSPKSLLTSFLGPTEEEEIPDVEDEEVGKKETEEVKEMRLTFEGFELVCKDLPSLLPVFTFELEIRKLGGDENTVSIPREVQGIPISGAHETCRQPTVPTRSSCKS